MAEASIIDGKAVAAGLRERLAAAAARLREEHGISAGLAAVLVGDDPLAQPGGDRLAVDDGRLRHSPAGLRLGYCVAWCR